MWEDVEVVRDGKKEQWKTRVHKVSLTYHLVWFVVHVTTVPILARR